MDSLKLAQVPTRYDTEGSPGRLFRGCGVWMLVPVQQPQLQLAVPVQLISSLALFPALHVQNQLTVIGKAGVVVQSSHLQRSQFDLSRGKVLRGRYSLGLKLGGRNGNHAGYRQGWCIHRAKVKGLAES